jgi:hypothetical protein
LPRQIGAGSRARVFLPRRLRWLPGAAASAARPFHISRFILLLIRIGRSVVPFRHGRSAVGRARPSYTSTAEAAHLACDGRVSADPHEKATHLYYRGLGCDIDEPLLKSILARMGAEEACHGTFFYNLLIESFRGDLDGLSRRVSTVAQDFKMPVQHNLLNYCPAVAGDDAGRPALPAKRRSVTELFTSAESSARHDESEGAPGGGAERRIKAPAGNQSAGPT